MEQYLIKNVWLYKHVFTLENQMVVGLCKDFLIIYKVPVHNNCWNSIDSKHLDA